MSAPATNPRKRMFQRALFALTKNDSLSSPPSAKRARVSSAMATDDNHNEHEDHDLARDSSRVVSTVSYNSFSTSFSRPPPSSSRNFLHDRHRLDHHRAHKPVRHTPETRLLRRSHSHSDSYSDQRRSRSRPRNTLSLTTKSRRHSHGHGHGHERRVEHKDQTREHRHDRHSHRHRHTHDEHRRSSSGHGHRHHHGKRHDKGHGKGKGVSYEYVELCRMKKLWTDFSGDPATEGILDELQFLEDTSYFITSNSIAHRISCVMRQLLSASFNAQGIPFGADTPLKLLDALACIGGNTYSFARSFASAAHEVYANELDAERFDALVHNMGVFAQHQLVGDVDAAARRLHLSNLDFVALHSTLGAQVSGAMDAIFLDPEWNNGDDYKQTARGQIHLFDIGGLHLYQVVARVLDEWYVNVRVVAIKVAKNYDEDFIHRKLKLKCKRIASGEFRVGQVAFHNQKLLLIVRDFGGGSRVLEQDEDEDVDVDVGLHRRQTFEEVFRALPARVLAETGSSGSGNSRDVISVKIVS